MCFIANAIDIILASIGTDAIILLIINHDKYDILNLSYKLPRNARLSARGLVIHSAARL